MEILTRLSLEARTAAELAEAMEIDVGGIRRQLGLLVRTGQAVRLQKTIREEHPEHLYSVELRIGVIPPEDLVGTPQDLIDRADLALLRVMFREVVDATEAGLLDTHAGRSLTRFPILLDRRRFQEAVGLHRRLLSEVIDEVGLAATRIARGDGEPIEMSLQIVFCEANPEDWPGPVAERRSARRSSRLEHPETVLRLIDPIRSKILDLLLVRPSGAGDLAVRLDIPPSKVRYELEFLLADGLVRVTGTKRNRGTAERIFVAARRGRVLDGEEIDDYSGPGMDAFNRWFVRTVFGETLEAIRTAGRREVEDVVIARVPTVVDATGFAAISRQIETVVDGLFDLRDSHLAEPAEGNTPTILGISGLLLFERAPLTSR